jgi:hypothetical protein
MRRQNSPLYHSASFASPSAFPPSALPFLKTDETGFDVTTVFEELLIEGAVKRILEGELVMIAEYSVRNYLHITYTKYDQIC